MVKEEKYRDEKRDLERDRKEERSRRDDRDYDRDDRRSKDYKRDSEKDKERDRRDERRDDRRDDRRDFEKDREKNRDKRDNRDNEKETKEKNRYKEKEERSSKREKENDFEEKDKTFQEEKNSKKRKENDFDEITSRPRVRNEDSDDEDGEVNDNNNSSEIKSVNTMLMLRSLGNKNEERIENSHNQENKRKTPIDLEEVLKKRQDEEQNKLKPTFLSKEEREKLALERRAKMVEEKQDKILEASQKRQEFLREAEQRRRKEEEENDRNRRRKMSREERERERIEREERERIEKEEVEKMKELERMKKEYLGGKREKKKFIKPSEKFRFVFDWNEDEDTAKEIKPLYSGDVRLLFGRGYMAGTDRKDQMKEYEKLLASKNENNNNNSSSNLESNSRREGIEAADRKNLNKQIKMFTKSELPETHWSQKGLEKMTQRDWRIFKEDFEITTKGGNMPNPIRYWNEYSFRESILEMIDKVGYKNPTPIQRQAIPVAMLGRDLMGIAETGSGKTAAYIIPLLDFILSMPKLTPETDQNGPYAIILAPARELVNQIEEETEKFAKYCGIRCVSLIGGVPIEEHGALLRKGCEIIIATPGRLNDCLNSRYVVLNQCTYIVLDEADRMIDMGFEPQVVSILESMPVSNLKSENEEEAEQQEQFRGKYRTTIMYSATMPAGVERLSRKYLRRPSYVIIGEIGHAVDRIKQQVEWISESHKLRRLIEVIQEGPSPPIIIFVNKKSLCHTIRKQLETINLSAITLNSDLNQEQRESAIQGFKQKKYDVLVATDLASRGLDVKGVTHVINYDLPKGIDVYTHRIGRTGRAGSSGLATSFLTSENTGIMYDLKQMLTTTGNWVPPELDKHPSSSVKPGSVENTRRKDTVIYKN